MIHLLSRNLGKGDKKLKKQVKEGLETLINSSIRDKFKKSIKKNIDTLETKIISIKSSINCEQFKKVREYEKVDNLIKSILLSVDLIMK